MPVITIYGIPYGTNSIKKLKEALARAVSSIPELNCKPKHTIVFTPLDLDQRGLGEKIVCIVEVLYKKPERTKAVRDTLAQRLHDTLSAFANDHLRSTCKVIEVFIKQFDIEEDSYIVMELPEKPRCAS